MKKLLSAVLCAVLLLTLCVAVSAEDVLYHFECEDGEITGAAKEYKDGNIQDVTIASGGKIVGLGGTNDAPQMASTVTFPEINLEKTGVYKIAFRYDTNAGDTKKADILVDGERYEVEINMDELPELYGEEFRTYELTITLEAGKHVIAVTTSEDFNRDANAGDVVKSVNADYVEVIFVKEVAAETEAEVVDTAAATEVVEAPKTADFAVSALVLLLSAGAAYVVSNTITCTYGSFCHGVMCQRTLPVLQSILLM